MPEGGPTWSSVHLSMLASSESSVVLLCSCAPGPFVSIGSASSVPSLGVLESFCCFYATLGYRKFLKLSKYNLVRLTVFPPGSCYFFGILHRRQNSSLSIPPTPILLISFIFLFLPAQGKATLPHDLSICFVHNWNPFHSAEGTGFWMTKPRRTEWQTSSFPACYSPFLIYRTQKGLDLKIKGIAVGESIG